MAPWGNQYYVLNLVSCVLGPISSEFWAICAKLRSSTHTTTANERPAHPALRLLANGASDGPCDPVFAPAQFVSVSSTSFGLPTGQLTAAASVDAGRRFGKPAEVASREGHFSDLVSCEIGPGLGKQYAARHLVLDTRSDIQ